MIIKSETLKAFRSRHSMSQADLSRATDGNERVSVSTIKRIESANGEYDANARIVKKLAEVLKVQPEDLTKEPQPPQAQDDDDRKKLLRESGYSPLKAVVDGETALAFQMVELLYGIPIRSQILMAPLFSALLAEGSFAWRRERLEAIDAAANELMSQGGGSFSFANAVCRVQNGARDEEDSISKRDLFGKEVGEDTYDLGFDPSKNNPFADYLQDFATASRAENIAFDPDEFGDWKTPEGLPEYRIAPDVIEKLTGGDYWAEFALLRGFARLRDIPENLRGENVADTRIEWLASQVPTEERERWEKMIAAIDLSQFGLADSSKPNIRED